MAQWLELADYYGVKDGKGWRYLDFNGTCDGKVIQARTFENVEAGVCYANRPQGSTTGAWPGFQPFGGWKGSGSTGKNAGGPYYLTSYMHEQSQTLIR